MSATATPAQTTGLWPWLEGNPDHVVLITADEQITRAELIAAVGRRTDELGMDRRALVVLEMANDVDSVVTYLACLSGGHPVILTAPGSAATLDGFGPDIWARGSRIERLRGADVESVELHPDLAILMSTSGSTGAAKLVRLSATNVLSNATSIGEALGIRATDRALTTLPLHYCYGLSVLNSHLAAGATVVLTDLSVTDAAIWDLAAEHAITTFPGVPWTFDLLGDGAVVAGLPSLRYLTQAGGRMAPDAVVRWSELGQRHGFDLAVMYGQTEATARMAILDADLARVAPQTVGRAVPGGEFRIDAPGPDGSGELVYTGPNVMLGYATTRADLARGRDVEELRTGDLARMTDEGLVEITGRASRFGKIAGLRIDLERVERGLDALAKCVVVAPAGRLHVYVDPDAACRPTDGDVEGFIHQVRRTAAESAGLAGAVVSIHLGSGTESFPRRSNGKIDYAALNTAALDSEAVDLDLPMEDTTVEAMCALFSEVLDRDVEPTDSFISVGGESLTYVLIASRLAATLGDLPRSWPSMTMTELAELAANPQRNAGWWQRHSVPLETPIVLRALAILAIVVSHVDLARIMGGAHLLLVLAGYNVARFSLPGSTPPSRRVLKATAAIAIPASLWIGACAMFGRYEWSTAFYLRGLLGSPTWSTDWQFWFLEVLIWTMLGWALLMAVPAVARVYRAMPWRSAVAVTLALLVVRFVDAGLTTSATQRYGILATAWFVALGCAVAESRTRNQRWVVVLVAATGTIGFFSDPWREALILIGIALVLWVATIRAPRIAARALVGIGAASLWIYLTHWQVYPPLENSGHPWLALFASIAVGIAAAATHRRLNRV